MEELSNRLDVTKFIIVFDDIHSSGRGKGKDGEGEDMMKDLNTLVR